MARKTGKRAIGSGKIDLENIEHPTSNSELQSGSRRPASRSFGVRPVLSMNLTWERRLPAGVSRKGKSQPPLAGKMPALPGSWPQCVQNWRSRLPMNLVGADVRRLIPIWAKEVRASLRRLLRFRGSIRERFREILRSSTAEGGCSAPARDLSEFSV